MISTFSPIVGDNTFSDTERCHDLWAQQARSQDSAVPPQDPALSETVKIFFQPRQGIWILRIYGPVLLAGISLGKRGVLRDIWLRICV